MTNAKQASEVIAAAVEALLYRQKIQKAQKILDLPPAEEVVNALIEAERQNKRTKKHFSYSQMLGTWQLQLVSGTQKVQTSPSAKSVKRPGKGRYLPQLVTIKITYGIGDKTADVEPAIGSVKNSVRLAPLHLCLTGPTRFWPATNSLAFDFTSIAVGLGSWTLYNGAVRGGQTRNQAFKSQSLKDQAFFTFFCVEEQYIAARGKGGGLALWTREKG